MNDRRATTPPYASEPHGPALREVASRLGRLRRRIRAVLALTATARWVVAAIAAATVFFLADRLLDLPLGVRRFVRLGLLDRPEGLDTPLWLFLLAGAVLLAVLATRAARGTAPFFAFAAAGLLGLLLWFAVRTLRPLGVPLPEEDLALAVERRFRQLNDRLAAALDFERELRDPTRGESAAMMTKVIEQVSEEAKGLEVARVVSIRRATRWSLGAMGAVAAVVVAAVVIPSTLSLWARRSLLTEDLEWPRATTIVALDLRGDGTLVPHDPSMPFRVAVGRPLVLHARAEGDVPDHVTLIDLSDERRPFRRRMIRVSDRPGVYAVEIRDVRRPFAFVLRGGDDDDDHPLWRVEVTVPPQVLDVRATLQFPEYLARSPETVEGGNLAVPEGTRTTVSFATDAPIETAQILLGEETLAAKPVEGGRHAFTFEALRAVRYRILLRTLDGRESDPAHDAYEVRVDLDRAPRLEWAWPRGPVEVTPNGRVPLLLEAVDDHGVAGMTLEVRLAEGEVLSSPLVPAGATATEPAEAPRGTPDGPAAGAREPIAAVDGPFGRAAVRAYVALEIATLLDAKGRPPVAPARIAVRLLAKDSKGQVKESAWSPIDVYRSSDLERSLAGRRMNVRADMAAVLADQVERRKQVEEVTKGPVDEAERDLLKTVQFAQAKIGQDVDRATRGLLSVVNDFVYDRLGAEGPNGKILAILDRHHRSTYGKAPPPSGDATHRSGDPVFPYAVYDEVVRGWRDRSIFDTAILDRMLAVVADAVDAAARLAPAAERETAAAASGELERLQGALAAQSAVVAALERVLDSMRSWQSLNDVILAVRRLTEEQAALNATVEKALERPGAPGRRESPR